eukprot:TRINITY_DN57039_c0_g1_i1.p1 TRINITY_DN57039_c0_g1~~TRINITY_DN57039_c0_g1_i1.p1  ORF type:complete len:348 (+),score=44.87 TRINITY_DN57039_c0_g1_i1:35-1078(+)
MILLFRLCCSLQRGAIEAYTSMVRKLLRLGIGNWFTTMGLESVEEAFARKDVHALVELLDSSRPIECSVKLHPWAENPRTAGSLATARLAMLVEPNDRREHFVEIARKSGAILKLLHHLQTREADYMHHAIVALSMLVGSHANAMEAYDAEALVLLVALVDDGSHARVRLESSAPTVMVPSEMRALAFSTIVKMCVHDEKIRRSFLGLDGFAVIVRQLGSLQEGASCQTNILVAIVLDIFDMIDPDRPPNAETLSLNDECAAAFLKAGGEKELLSALSYGGDVLQSTVNDLLDLLAAKGVSNEEIRLLLATAEVPVRFAAAQCLRTLEDGSQHDEDELHERSFDRRS